MRQQKLQPARFVDGTCRQLVYSNTRAECFQQRVSFFGQLENPRGLSAARRREGVYRSLTG